MIYTYSVLKGYQAMQGNMMLHFSLAIATLIYIRVPDGLGVAIATDLSTLYNMQLLIHWINGLTWAMATDLQIWKHMELATDIGSILGIILSFFVFMQQFRVLTFLADKDLIPDESRDLEINKFHFWVLLEVFFVFAVVMSNCIYCMLRFCEKTKIYI